MKVAFHFLKIYLGDPECFPKCLQGAGAGLRLGFARPGQAEAGSRALFGSSCMSDMSQPFKPLSPAPPGSHEQQTGVENGGRT